VLSVWLLGVVVLLLVVLSIGETRLHNVLVKLEGSERVLRIRVVEPVVRW